MNVAIVKGKQETETILVAFQDFKSLSFITTYICSFLKLLENSWKICQRASIIHKKNLLFCLHKQLEQRKVFSWCVKSMFVQVCSRCLSRACDTSILTMSKIFIVITISFSRSSFKHNKMLEFRFPAFLRGHFSKLSHGAGHCGRRVLTSHPSPTPPPLPPKNLTTLKCVLTDGPAESGFCLGKS